MYEWINFGFCQASKGDVVKKMDDSLSDISDFLRACSNSYVADEKPVLWEMWGSTDSEGFWEAQAFQSSKWATEVLVRQQHKSLSGDF